MPKSNKRVRPSSLESSAPAIPALRWMFFGPLFALALGVGLGESVTAQVATTGVAPRVAPPARGTAPKSLSILRPTAFATIKGSALGMTQAAVSKTTVRLRDARRGRIVGSEFTDKDGLFVFHGVEPGSYIVEVIDENQSVIASSQLISANAGELTAVVLKLPSNLTQLGRIVGSTTPSNAALEAQAATAGGVAAARAGTPISER